MITAIVLAAGLSRRMGKDNKLLMTLKEKPILLHTLEAIIASKPEEVIVVLGHEVALIEPLLLSLPIQKVYNPEFKTGMTSSIQSGVIESHQETKGFMICLSDLPFLVPEEYRLLMDTFLGKLEDDPKLILKPIYQSKPGNPILFSAYYRDLLLQHPEPDGCKGLVKQYKQHLQLIEMEFPHCIQDIDTKSEYDSLT